MTSRKTAAFPIIVDSVQWESMMQEGNVERPARRPVEPKVIPTVPIDLPAAGVPGAPGFIIEEETSDDFLDAPELVYEPDGKTLLQRLAAEGYDISELGTLADQIEQRTGRKIAELPPLNDGG